MGFFDSIGNGISSMFGNADPMRAAQVRGGMLGAAQALLQPYSGFGNAFAGAGIGAQQGKENYLQDQYIGLRNQEMQDQLNMSRARRAALNNLFLGNNSATPTAPVAPAGPQQTPSQSQPAPGPMEFGGAPSAPVQTAPMEQTAQATQMPGGIRLPPGYTLDQIRQRYAIDPEGTVKLLFPEPQKYPTGVYQGVNPQTQKPDQFRYDQYTGQQIWGQGQHEIPKPMVSGNQESFDYGKTWTPIPGAVEQAKAIAAAGAQGRLSSAGFSDREAELMGALAERGVSLPTGFRSKEQQKALYSGILARNPDRSPDEIADLIKRGQIEFGAQKKETQTAAAVAGKVELARNEIDQFVPLVRQAAAAVPRGNWMDLNRLLQTADSHLSDPNLKVLKGRINALMNAYDLLASRGGTDVDKRKEAHALLTSADGPEALNRQLDNFLIEAQAAKRAAIEATKVPELSGQPSPKSMMPAKIKGDADYDKLKSGAYYIGPDGVTRQKP